MTPRQALPAALAAFVVLGPTSAHTPAVAARLDPAAYPRRASGARARRCSRQPRRPSSQPHRPRRLARSPVRMLIRLDLSSSAQPTIIRVVVREDHARHPGQKPSCVYAEPHRKRMVRVYRRAGVARPAVVLATCSEGREPLISPALREFSARRRGVSCSRACAPNGSSLTCGGEML